MGKAKRLKRLGRRQRPVRQDVPNLPEIEIDITPELVEEAKRGGWSGGDLLATAMQRSAVRQGLAATDIEVGVGPNPNAEDPELRRGYIGVPRASRENIGGDDS